MEDTDEPAHISEGLPSCLSSVLIFFILPDYPETAHWLTEDEKKLAAYRLKDQGSKGSSKPMTWGEAKETLTDWRLYAHYAVCPNFLHISELGNVHCKFRSTLEYLPHFQACHCSRRRSLLD
jgi:hypothetical protein